MAGLQGGHREPSNGNGRCGGGTGGAEHRYHFPMVDTARWDNASRGTVDTDERWSGAVGQELTYPNTMGVARGTMMGASGPGPGASGFVSLGGGSGQSTNGARTAAAQAYNDAASTYSGVVANAGAGGNAASTSTAQAVNNQESIR